MNIGSPIKASRYISETKDQLMNDVKDSIAHLAGESEREMGTPGSS
ncbi:MAG: hypothetical protein J7L53_07185 [Deltaproteobacteria bacterium]|nr:hypothetical protein [Deltaproteobacteria bacterium]